MFVNWVARALLQDRTMTLIRICIIKEKLDCYNYRGKNTSVIHDAVPPIQLLLTNSNSEAVLNHSECAYVWHCVMENFWYKKSMSCYLIFS